MMTPERKEEIKRWSKEFTEAPVSVVHELMAALEETEQQNKNLKYTIQTLKFNRDSWEEAEKKGQRELAEAQQTIARQREEIERMKFPRQPNGDGEWTIEYKFIESLEAELLDTTQYASSMEQIEAVLLLVEKRIALGEGAKES